MLVHLIRQLKISILLLCILTLITGIIYPYLITGIAQLLFPWRANGSLIELQGHLIGSQLIGQAFDNPAYFWGRPSATTPFPYNSYYSSGSNISPTNPNFLSTVKSRIALLHQADLANQQFIPIDLVTTSASGLDPEISPAAALYQVSRIAKIRQIPAERIIAIINAATQNRAFYLLGEPRVNVLQMNIALSQLSLPEENRNSHERQSP
ncbi:MAG: potassium-transporting ATPase subunit KdpC [Gammaproteobacteria bacterium]|nr:potassium-transporting ATPase subunit KdpC [Gammaproteobacteria bacterium]